MNLNLYQVITKIQQQLLLLGITETHANKINIKMYPHIYLRHLYLAPPNMNHTLPQKISMVKSILSPNTSSPSSMCHPSTFSYAIQMRHHPWCKYPILVSLSSFTIQYERDVVVVFLAIMLWLLMVVVGLVENKVRRGTIMKEKRGPGNYVRTMIVVAGLGEKVVRKGADMTHIGTTA